MIKRGHRPSLAEFLINQEEEEEEESKLAGDGRLAAIFFVVVIISMLIGWKGRLRLSKWLWHPAGSTDWTMPSTQLPECGPDLDLGTAILPFIISPNATHRRIEKVKFVGMSRAVRQVSVDVDVPGAGIVPVGLADKRNGPDWQSPLRDFNVVSGGGDCVALIGHQDRAVAAWSLTCTALARTASTRDLVKDLPPDSTHLAAWSKILEDLPDVPHLLWRIVTEPAGNAERLLKKILDVPPVGEARDPLSSGGHPAVRPDAGAGVPTGFSDSERRSADLIAAAVDESALFQALLRRLAGNYILFVQLKPQDAGQRTIVKYTLADPIPAPLHIMRLRKMAGAVESLTWYERQYLKSWSGLSYRLRFGIRARVFLAWFGWSADSIAPAPMNLLPARTVHFEVEAPEGLRFTHSELRRSCQYDESVSHERIVDRELYKHPTLTHMFFSRVRLDEQLTARLDVVCESSELCLTGLIALLLSLYFWIAKPDYGSSRPGEETVLLLIPAITAAYLQLRHHKFVRRVSRGIRWLVATVVGLAFAAATMVVASSSMAPTPGQPLPSEPVIFTASWVVAAWISTLAATALIPAIFRARPYARSWPRGGGSVGAR